MTPDAPWLMRTRTNAEEYFQNWNKMHNWFHVDWERVRDWSMDAVAKRTLIVSGIAMCVYSALMMAGIPMISGVRGQTPPTAQQIQATAERDDILRRLDKLEQIPAELSVIVAEQRVEDEHYKEEREFRDKVSDWISRMVYGMFALIASFMTIGFTFLLNHMGISLFTFSKGDKHVRR